MKYEWEKKRDELPNGVTRSCFGMQLLTKSLLLSFSGHFVRGYFVQKRVLEG
jgi:hypothetical protein